MGKKLAGEGKSVTKFGFFLSKYSIYRTNDCG
jgi:hypothetical protein